MEPFAVPDVETFRKQRFHRGYQKKVSFCFDSVNCNHGSYMTPITPLRMI